MWKNLPVLLYSKLKLNDTSQVTPKMSFIWKSDLLRKLVGYFGIIINHHPFLILNTVNIFCYCSYKIFFLSVNVTLQFALIAVMTSTLKCFHNLDSPERSEELEMLRNHFKFAKKYFRITIDFFSFLPRQMRATNL